MAGNLLRPRRGDEHPDGLPNRGDLVGPYRIVDEIGRGSLGVVYRAMDTKAARMVAVKVPRPGAHEAEEELRSEARLTARFRHRNIVRTLGSGQHEGIPFLALELLDGEDLATRIDEGGALAIEEALRIGADVARGLSALHRIGVVHRDLKPTNVRLCDDGRAKILDLGTPGALRRRLPRGGFEYFGTPEYSAPEQCTCEEAKIGPATDLYALGILLYEMISGRPPFNDRRTTKVLRDQVNARVVPLEDLRADIPGGLADLLQRLLRKDPMLRPQRAGAVALELEKLKTLPRSTGGGRASDGFLSALARIDVRAQTPATK